MYRINVRESVLNRNAGFKRKKLALIAWPIFTTVLILIGASFYVLANGNLAIAAPIMTFMIFVIGMPLQIYKIRKNESAADLSFLRLLIGFVGCVVWIGYSVDLKNWILLGTNILGTIGIFVIICQYFYYEMIKKPDWYDWRKYI